MELIRLCHFLNTYSEHINFFYGYVRRSVTSAVTITPLNSLQILRPPIFYCCSLIYRKRAPGCARLQIDAHRLVSELIVCNIYARKSEKAYFFRTVRSQYFGLNCDV